MMFGKYLNAEQCDTLCKTELQNRVNIYFTCDQLFILFVSREFEKVVDITKYFIIYVKSISFIACFN